MSFSLPASVYTPQLVQTVVFDVETLRDYLSHAKVQRKVGAKPDLPPGHAVETETVLKAWLDGKEPTITNLTELLTALNGLKLTTVHLTMAALPSDPQRLKLVEWFRSNCRPDLLVSFSADRTIGGGIIIRTPNRMFDLSFRQQLMAGQQKLPEIIRAA